MRKGLERNHKHLQRRLVMYWFFCSVVFFIILVSFYSIKQYENKKTFISAVPKQNLDQQTETINTILGVLKEKHITFSGVFVFDSASYLVKLASGEEVFLASGKSLVEQVSSLQLILSRLTIEGKRVSRVDFRFDTPVLTMQ